MEDTPKDVCLTAQLHSEIVFLRCSAFQKYIFFISISELLMLLVTENKFQFLCFTAYNQPKAQHVSYFQ